MLKIEKKKDCCGCGACANVCPKNCIELKSDKEGFLYPKIDKEKCVDCGLCEKVCPIANSESRSESVLKSYAAFSPDNELRKKSSSGGMFSLFANIILDKGGVVYGAAFDNKFLVHHVGIESKDELYKLQGSKYLQSRTENTFKEVKENLNKGRYVLYTGTACQIAGLKSFLRKDYEKLYTVDVLCHGVPSPKVWKKYLAEQEKIHGADVTKAFFRNKDTGWKSYSVELEFSNSKKYTKTFGQEMFMKLFLQNICLRPSCHDCKFKSLERESDITIGDAWGIENHSPEMNDNMGVSVVLVHSQKGIELFDAIKENIKLKEVKKDVLLPPSADSRKSVLPHRNRKKFFEMLNNGTDFETLEKLLKPNLYTKCRRFAGKILRKFKKL